MEAETILTAYLSVKKWRRQSQKEHYILEVSYSNELKQNGGLDSIVPDPSN